MKLDTETSIRLTLALNIANNRLLEIKCPTIATQSQHRCFDMGNLKSMGEGIFFKK